MAVKAIDFSNTEHCPVRNVLDRFGDKWSILILVILEQMKVVRFNELHKTIGDISQKMLTVTLRTLEADGLVSRKIYPVIPPKVEYQLTDLGKSLLPLIGQLSDWAKQNYEVIMTSRETFSKSV